MKKWNVGITQNLPTIIIEAETFDEAIKKARAINKNYSSAQPL